MAKNRLFSGLGGFRRTPPASSHALDSGSTWYFRGRHLYSLALPDTERVGRGLSLSRNRASTVARAGFDRRVDNLQPEKHKLRRLQPAGEKTKQTFFLFFSHSGGT